MATYVLVHGAWHTGDMLEDTARPIRAMGHQVHCPTLAGNRPGESGEPRLEDAIDSLVEYFNEHRISDAVVAGHSYGGIVISGLADRLGPGRIHRLVYWNAFVPHSGEGASDMAPPKHAAMFRKVEEEGEGGGVVLPFPVWRENFINDGDYALAKKTYDQLNPQPVRTLTDKLLLKTEIAEMPIGKSYLNCQQDIAMPGSFGWHPRLSEKLGLFRLVEMPGSHEVCFTNPALLGEKLMEAGRD
jgi:pimeloyl-ACP methyl ester carboxylesterase